MSEKVELPKGYLESLPRPMQPDLEHKPTCEMKLASVRGVAKKLRDYLASAMCVVRHEWGAFGEDDGYAVCSYCGRQPEGNNELNLDMGETGHKKECVVARLLLEDEEIRRLVKMRI